MVNSRIRENGIGDYVRDDIGVGWNILCGNEIIILLRSFWDKIYEGIGREGG